jgi:hypothetical protein
MMSQWVNSESQASLRRARPTASIRNGDRPWPSTPSSPPSLPPSSPIASSQQSSSLWPESESDTQHIDLALVDLGRWSEPSQSAVGSEDSRPSKKTRKYKQKPRSSWVFQHMPDEDQMTKYWLLNDRTFRDEDLVWRCKYCPATRPKEFKLSGGTRGPSQHLINDHGITDGMLYFPRPAGEMLI